VTLSLVPFALDQPTSLAFAAAALRVRLVPGEELDVLLPPLESAIRSARASGGLLRSEGRARGLVHWEPAGPLGVALRLLYLSDGDATAASYREALDLTERAAGPIAFIAGPLAGLSEDEESEFLRGRGYAPYGRSEMTLPPAAVVPLPSGPEGTEVRAVRPGDEPLLARLHENAYRRHLDRFLALEDTDPARDADRQVRDYFTGRWGELLSPGSSVVLLDQRMVAAALTVRRTHHALILDVMADPSRQGKGFGRAALTHALRALREAGQTKIVLNVTEGNERAIRLYSSLGFVRSIGPSSEWYDARRMPVDIPVPGPGQSVADGRASAGR
jgi:ribosomal protein S18 acetylase RimI-like enzyme